MVAKSAAWMRGGWQGSHHHRFSPYSTMYRSHGNLHSAYNNHGSYGYSNPGVQSNIDYSYPVSASSTSWSRTSSFASPYSSTTYETEPTNSYSSQNGPSFLLPNSDPMASSTTHAINPYTRSQNTHTLLQESASPLPSQQHVSQYHTTPYTGSAYNSALQYSTLADQATTPLRAEHANGYNLLNVQPPAVVSHERTLPYPSRQYSTSQMSALDSLPLSAGSRSSIGWPAETSSNSSNASSQTSCSSAGGYTDPATDKYSNNRNNSQDLGYSFIDHTTSPSTLPPSSLPVTAPDHSIAHTSLTGMPTISELEQQPRCRTVSQESLADSSNASNANYGYTGGLVARDVQEQSCIRHTDKWYYVHKGKSDEPH